MFGTAKEDDKLIESPFPSDCDVGVNSLNALDLQQQIESCHQEMMDNCFLSSLDDEIINID